MLSLHVSLNNSIENACYAGYPYRRFGYAHQDIDDARRRQRHAKRESMDKKTWLGHAALSCDYNARNWKTGRENYLKLVDRISFLKDRYFASFVTNRPFAASHSRDTNPPYWKAREAVWQGIVCLCELLRLLYHSFRFYASLSSLRYCHFLLVKLCNCNMCCENKRLLKKDKKGNNYIKLYKPFVYLVPVLPSCTTLMTSCKGSI